MDIQQVLKIPKGELAFNSPKDVPKDRHDWRYGTLRSDLGHRGLRYWQSFEEKPTYTQKLLKLPTGIPENWRSHIHLWDRFAASELSIADFYKKTLIQRVNIGLEAVCPGVRIVGTPRHFPSYGTYDNRIEGDAEKLVGPDLLVFDADCFDGDFIHPPNLQNSKTSLKILSQLAS
ncbi:hypothetical protein MAJ_09819, partial [Metarhizium majus ARSEF 297]